MIADLYHQNHPRSKGVTELVYIYSLHFPFYNLILDSRNIMFLLSFRTEQSGVRNLYISYDRFAHQISRFTRNDIFSYFAKFYNNSISLASLISLEEAPIKILNLPFSANQPFVLGFQNEKSLVDNCKDTVFDSPGSNLIF